MLSNVGRQQRRVSLGGVANARLVIRSDRDRRSQNDPVGPSAVLENERWNQWNAGFGGNPKGPRGKREGAAHEIGVDELPASGRIPIYQIGRASCRERV